MARDTWTTLSEGRCTSQAADFFSFPPLPPKQGTLNKTVWRPLYLALQIRAIYHTPEDHMKWLTDYGVLYVLYQLCLRYSLSYLDEMRPAFHRSALVAACQKWAGLQINDDDLTVIQMAIYNTTLLHAMCCWEDETWVTWLSASCCVGTLCLVKPVVINCSLG